MKRLFFGVLTVVLFIFLLIKPVYSSEEARLLRFPDISHGKIVFVYGGDLWTVAEKGGNSVRLSSHAGLELFPKFSPDGKKIAFSAQYDGNMQLYVMSAEGGKPKQLTYRPGWAFLSNQPIAWYPDGKKILFRTKTTSHNRYSELYSVSTEGGLAEKLILPEGGMASFSPDGTKIAYNRIFLNFDVWKRYKGGLAQDIWVYDFKNNATKQITKYIGNDTFPMWYKDRIYYVCDNNKQKRMNIYCYSLKDSKITQVTNFSDYDVNWPSLSVADGKIVFEKGGFLFVLNLANQKVEKVKVYLSGADYKVLPQWVSVQKSIDSYGLSPDGNRAVLTARGNTFTIGAKRNDIVNLTNTSGVRERHSTWSPDGRWIAYTSDKSGEYEVYIREANNPEKEIQITKGNKCFLYALVWSPDSKKLLYSDSELRLFYVDINLKKPIFINKSSFGFFYNYSWSPDSHWVAFSKSEYGSERDRIYLYSLEKKKAYLITDKFSESWNPVFDPSGRYLYFLSRRTYNPIKSVFELDFVYTHNAGVYVVTLRKEDKSPIEPPEDKVKVKTDTKTKETKKIKKPKKVVIDLAGIQDRVVKIPVKIGNLRGLAAHKNKLFYLAYPLRGMGGKVTSDAVELHLYDVKEREDKVILSGLNGYALSFDGKKIIYRAGENYGVIDSTSKAKAGDGKLDLSALKIELEPKKEWEQMYNEAWRMQRDYFYSPKMNSVNWLKVKKQYAVLLPYVTTKFDFMGVLMEMMGELGNSHTYVSVDLRDPARVKMGLLGVDFALDKKSGFYRLKRIYRGENWDSEMRSPLTEAGINVKQGDYLLAVNGQPLKYPDNPYRLLRNTAKEKVILLVNSKPSLTGAKEVRVTTIAEEYYLRQLDWVRENRQRVHKLSGGLIGYVYLPDMGQEGLDAFNKQFYPQIKKAGLIIDVRYNGGGFVSEVILERLRRVVMGMYLTRNWKDVTTYPEFVFHGHMACVTNAYAASDGDFFSYYFQQYKIGPLVGMRTWGGVRGIMGSTKLLDGTTITVPSGALYSLDRKWLLENYGVTPDIEVDNRADLVIKGRDLQLEKAVEVLMAKIKKNPKKLPAVPPYSPAYPEEGIP